MKNEPGKQLMQIKLTWNSLFKKFDLNSATICSGRFPISDCATKEKKIGNSSQKSK
jgi:hypothetical protein